MFLMGNHAQENIKENTNSPKELPERPITYDNWNPIDSCHTATKTHHANGYAHQNLRKYELHGRAATHSV